MVSQAFEAAVQRAKTRINAMLTERQALQTPGVTTPSRYWLDFCEYFDYLPSLSAKDFEKIRLHTYHLTGDYYQLYYFGRGEWFQHQFTQMWRGMKAEVPPEYVLTEPANGIGMNIDGQFISRDIQRFQRTINDLYKGKVIDQLNQIKRRKFVLEIGAGYGGMIHQLARFLPDTTFVVLDLPETMLYSTIYLPLQRPDYKLYIYDPADYKNALKPDVLSTYDVAFFPNYRIDDLRHLRFDLVVNIDSLQEMTNDQVQTYLEFLQQTTAGTFYSFNQDRNVKNMELDSVSNRLGKYFDLELIYNGVTMKTKHKIASMLPKPMLKRLLPGFSAFLDNVPYGPKGYLCRPRRKG